MDRIAPTAPPPELQLRAPQLDADQGPAAQAAERRLEEHTATRAVETKPNEARIKLDADAQRFVFVLTDPNTEQTVRRYPSESQLAYSRAVMAYLRALGAKP